MPKTLTLALGVMGSLAFAAVAPAAGAEKLVVAPMENAASLSADELVVLTGSVQAALVGRSTDFEVMALASIPGVPCDAVCVEGQAKGLGARYVVRGRVALFGGQYTVQLDAVDRADGTVAASSVTPPATALVEVLPLARSAAETLLSDLAARAKPSSPAPAPAPYAPPAPRPRPAAAPPTRWAQPSSDLMDPGPNMAGIVVHTDPPGAKVWLGHSMVFIGTTPTHKIIAPGGTRVTVRLDGYKKIDKKAVELFAGETAYLRFKLEKRERLMEAGAPLLCIGVIAAIPSAILLGIAAGRDDGELKVGGGILTAISGSLALTGIALLVANGVKRRHKKSNDMLFVGDLAVLPGPDGVAMGYSRTF